MRPSTARIDVMQSLPVVFGLGEIEAAAAIGISASKFRRWLPRNVCPRLGAWTAVIYGTWMSCGRHSRPFRMKARAIRPIHGRTWRDPAQVCARLSRSNGSHALLFSPTWDSDRPTRFAWIQRIHGGATARCSAKTPETVIPRSKAAQGTFAALAIRYYGSPQYHSLSATSRANYRRVIDGFLEEHGHRQVKEMTREHVDIIIGKMANKPGAGIILLKRVRTLVRYALALGWINRDPTAGARSYRSKEIHTWNEEEIETFEKRWPEGTRERLAFALLLYTGQRGSDVHRMLWADYTGGTIRVAQQKTATKLTIPIHKFGWL